MSAGKHTPGPEAMRTLADALRWALGRIETAKLGQGDYFDRADALLAASDAAHPDDAAVDEFAALLKAKLAKARDKGKAGWRDPAWPAADINRQMHEHAAKGDPLDVAAYAMFLALRGEATTGAEQPTWRQWEEAAALGEHGWTCSSCCTEFLDGMPETCPHNANGCDLSLRVVRAEANCAKWVMRHGAVTARLDDALGVLGMVDTNNRIADGGKGKAWRGSFVAQEVRRVLAEAAAIAKATGAAA